MKHVLNLSFYNVNENSFTYKMILAFLLSWIYAASSQLFITLPFEFVPITLQTFILFLAPFLFGRIAFNATVLWLLQGALGFPMFFGFSSGVAHLLGPTGGYLIGFLFSTYFLSAFSKHGKNRFKLFLSLLIALLVLHVCGLFWISFFVPLNINMLLFFLIDLLKISFILLII